MTTHNSNAIPAPLAGLRVVEVGQAVCAPLCARHLSDLGAEVIKVEGDRGDLARSYDAVVKGTSAYFTWANYGKKSVVFDLKSDEGADSLRALLRTADVFVHNLGPGAMDRLGFSSGAVAEINPQIVYCGISGYGTAGPLKDRKAFDLLVQGEAGLMSVTGTADEVAKVGISIVDMCTAVYALSAIEAALLRRATTGLGATLDISLFDCISEWMMAPTYHQMYAGRAPRREGARHNMMVPYGVYATGETSSVNFAVQTDHHWRLLCDVVVGEPDLADHPDYALNADRVSNRTPLEQHLEERFMAIGHDEVVRRLLDSGIPTAEVNDLAGLADHPQLAARNRWMVIDTPGGQAQALRPPFNIAGHELGQLAVPGLGEHTADVIASVYTSAPRD